MLALASRQLFAADLPSQSFTYQGKFFNSSGTAPLTSVVDLVLEIYSPGSDGTAPNDCLLYSEKHSSIDLSLTGGMFSVQVGSSVGSPKRLAIANGDSKDDPGLTMAQIFSNKAVAVRAPLSADCVPGYTPASGEARRLRVTVIDGGVPTILSPDQVINAVPHATNAETLQGVDLSNLIQASGSVTQSNVTKVTDGSDISALGLHSHDNAYLKSASSTNQNLGSGTLYSTGKVGIGTSAPSASFEIVGPTGAAFRLADGNQGNGKILVSDATGNATWQTAASLVGATGASGAQGVSGATGADGAVGNSGSTGASGAQGNSGATGASGAQGDVGATGASGAQGSSGATGASGAQGEVGATGASGAQGNSGATGASGAQGMSGATGASGTDGAVGNTGASGAQGMSGATGASGANGAIGNTGASGAQGMSGATGASGANGAIGNTGASGATGAAGAQGNSGATGATGDAGAMGFTGASGATGAQGSVGFSGATGASGAQGNSGATGASGAQGDVGATGASGAQGSSGATGASGAQGMSGATGASGTDGAVGNTGASGAQGMSGATGASGANGAIGNTGASGATGAAGAQGNSGATGATGDAGAMGFTGASGATGAQGSVGSSGATGASGAQGNSGATGASGTQGNVGATGASGAQGNSGATGASGAQGDVGATGASGAQGNSGATGASGAQGANGATGASGTDGAVGNTGASGAQGLSGATGASGANGAIGNTGASGATGAAGAQGNSGATGATGDAGAMGFTGASGATGAQGSVGSSGATGASGAQGNSGATGASGAQGNSGATGASGTDGAVGNTGASGAQGTSGATGASGAQGMSGSTGASGAQGSSGATGATGASPWSISGNDINYTVGNVGIGTTNPTGPLHIKNASWSKVTLETNGTAALARQAADQNGLNFTSNAYWNGSAWSSDDATKSSFAYIQHLGNSQMEFRVAPAGGLPTWNTAMVINSTGKVGIGTTAPGDKLTIAGTSDTFATIDVGAVGRAAQLKFSRGASSTYMGLSATNNFDLWSFENVPFRIGTNNTERFSINTSGLVGVGANPLYSGQLSVSSSGTTKPLSIQNTNGSFYSGIDFMNSAGTFSGHVGYSNATAPNWADSFYVGSVTAKPVVVTTNNAERLRVTSTGEVGIGTTSPGATLHIVGPTGAAFRLVDGSQGVGMVLTSDASGFATWSSAGALAGATGASGATGAQGTQGNSGATGATGADGSQGATGASGAQGMSGATGASGAQGSSGVTGATGDAGAQGTSGATGATGASPFSLNGSIAYYTSGNVGIGTTAPGFQLEVTSQTKLNALTVGTNITTTASLPGFGVNHSDGTGYMGAINAAIGSGTQGALQGAVYTGTNTSDKYGLMTLARNNSGWYPGSLGALVNGDYLAGIGFAGQTDTSPSTGMHVGASIIPQIDGTVASGALPTALTFRTTTTNNTALAERMRITSSGNVGVGTTGPGSRLEVVGSNGSGVVGSFWGSSGADGYVHINSPHSNGRAGFMLNGRGGGGVNSWILQTGGTDQNLYLHAGNNVNGSPVVATVTNSGKLGLGTAAPSSTVSIQKDLSGAGDGVKIQTAASGLAANWYGPSILGQNSRGTIAAPLDNGDADILLSLSGKSYSSSGWQDAASIRLLSDGAPGFLSAPGRIEFLTTPSGSNATVSRMVIKNSGEVGIGTPNPGATLHVVGPTGAALRLADGTQGAGRFLTSDASGNASWTTLSAGPSGATGATGAQGAQGQSGSTGANGASGVTGATGTDGAQGLTGATGADGTQGATGASGAQGESGVTGATGASPFSLNAADAYYTAGKVGIGTSAPATTLHVVGDIRYQKNGAVNTITLSDYLGSQPNIKLSGSDSSVPTNISSQGPLRLFAGNTDLSSAAAKLLLTGTTSGTIGIGTSSPGAQLEVDTTSTGTIGLKVWGLNGQTAYLQSWGIPSNGTMMYYAASGELRNFGSIYGFGINSADGGGYTGINLDGNNRSIKLTVPGSSTADIRLYRSSANTLTLDNNSDGAGNLNVVGRVGIGTTGPTGTLHVAGPTGAAFVLVDGTQGAGKVLTSDANGFASWSSASVLAGATGATGASPFLLNGSSAYYNSGNLGVGTSSPAVGIHILQGQDVPMRIETTGTYAPGFDLWTSGTRKGTFGIVNVANQFVNGSAVNDFVFRPDAGGNFIFGKSDESLQLFKIMNSGNVGIGTNSPAARLSVAGSNAAGNADRVLSVVAGNSTDGGAGGDVYLAAGNNTGGSGSGGSTFTLTGGQYGGGGGPVALNAGNGGNGAPGGAVTLTGGRGTGEGYGGSISVGGGAYSPGNGGNVTILGGSKGGSGTDGNVLLATTRGKVGIGTTSPQASLHVAGPTGAAFRLADGSEGAGKFLSSDASGNATWTAATAGPSGATGASGAAGLTGATGASPFIVSGSDAYYTAGKIGIGTSSPSAVLHVKGADATSNQYMMFESNCAGCNTTGLKVYNSAIGNGNKGSLFLEAASDGGSEGVYGQIDGLRLTNTSGALVFGTNTAGVSTEKMRIDSAGNVGIGVTSPSSKLEVNGDVSLTASSTAGTVRTISINGTSAYNNLRMTANADGQGGTAARMDLNGGAFSGGSVTITAGQGAATNGGPGNVTITAGNTTNPTGGAVSLAGGNSGNNIGGNVYLVGGAGGTTPGNVILGSTSSGTLRGYVGVGTTSPAVTFHVAGPTGAAFRLADGNQGAGKFLSSDASGNATWTALSAGPSGATGASGAAGVTGATGASPWGTAGSDTYYTTGNVGIGTSSPSHHLTVTGSARIDSGPGSLTTVSGAHLAGDTTINVGSTTGYPSSGALFIAGEAMTYTGTTATSFTGVTRGAYGTTAAALSGSENVDYFELSSARTASGNQLSVTANFASIGSTKLYMGGLPTTNRGYLTGNGNSLNYSFCSNASCSGGQAIFDVTYGSSFNLWSTKLNIGATGSAGGPVLYFNSDTTTGFFRPAANEIGLSSSSVERLRLTASGNIGIGTSTPAYPLSVYRATAGTTSNVESGNAGSVAQDRYAGLTAGSSAQVYGAGLNISDGNGGYEVYDYTAGASRMFINTSGNVGIGTTGPASKLTVAGTIESTSGGVKYPDGTTQTSALGAHLLVVDQKAAGTAGGSSVAGTWTTRTLNTVKFNAITGASLASNQLTLPAGTYYVRGRAPAYFSGRHQAVLYSVTDTANLLTGTSSLTGTTNGDQTESIIEGQITLTGTTVLEIRHNCASSAVTTGFGSAANLGVAETFSSLYVQKIQ